MKIFISYSSKDRPLVNTLAEELEVMGYEVWYDQRLDRRGGHKWWTEIMAALRDCDIFLYVASPNLIKSVPCKSEYGYAVDLGKPILPVQIAEVQIRELPREIRDTQICDARDLKQISQRRAIRASLASLPPAPPLPDNALALAPPVPSDPVADLLDRIKTLSSDVDRQRLVILAIEDLYADHHTVSDVIDLLERLIDRDDVLTVRNLNRSKDLLAKVSAGHADPPPVTPKAGDRMVDPHGVTMVYVPAGEFLMGSTERQVNEAFEQAKKENANAKKEWYTNQLPQHRQIITTPFWLDLTPVTNAAYQEFIADGGYRNQALWTAGGWAWVQSNNKTEPNSYNNFTDPQQPRVGVTWFEAYAYCQWRGGRLPTEAEWEWAARGPENRIYPWGNTFKPDYVIYDQNSGGKSAVVGDGIRAAGASWVGALDMSGNVWEWCNSLYLPYPQRNDDPHETLLNSTNVRVLRGGSWNYVDIGLRSADRGGDSPSGDSINNGFRCALSY